MREVRGKCESRKGGRRMWVSLPFLQQNDRGFTWYEWLLPCGVQCDLILGRPAIRMGLWFVNPHEICHGKFWIYKDDLAVLQLPSCS